MKVKVKTIINKREDWFDDEINEFIQHKDVIDIKFSVYPERFSTFNALIMYKDIK